MPDDPSASLTPAPGAKRRALEAEEAHLARVHERIEQLRERADARLAAASSDRSGSTFQAQFERDVTAHHHSSRAARFTFGDVESLVFGRMDLTDGDALHVGRVSVVDQAGDVILVDWRAPAAADFYQATAARPRSLARRRTLVTRGRHVRDLDDEILDAEAAEKLGLTPVSGQGALLASLARERSGTMRDIVATIQGDQDEIIRSPATGTLVVTGGPGTGKTVVALHRVASLLYRDRERFEGRGVLVIGPSTAFTEYTAKVLPSLGEDRAVQRPLSALVPRGADVHGWDDPQIGRIKGDLAMVEVCQRLLVSVLPPLPPDTRVSFEGTTAVVSAATVKKLRDRQLERVKVGVYSYHERLDAADEALRALLFRQWSKAHRAAGGQVPEDRERAGFDAALRASAQVTMLRRCYWPELDAETVLRQLVDGEVALDELADGLLEADDVASLSVAFAAQQHWKVDDVGLLDELDALLGKVEIVEREAPTDVGLRLSADDLRVEVETVDVQADEYRDFAHVVVDEAQDLTPMQWRAVARRGPYASWTVVGDLAQRSRVAEPSTWQEVGRLIGRREVVIRHLDVNYRTPAEIAELARAVLAAAGHDPAHAPSALRTTGEAPRLITASDPVARTYDVVAKLAAERDGTIALIAPEQVVSTVRDAVEGLPEEVLERLNVIDPRTAKGLEFDDVVIVAPDGIVAESSVGTHQLYVAVTRATRTLTILADQSAQFPAKEMLET